MGLPLSQPDPLFTRTSGDFYARATLHRLALSAGLGPVQYMALYPSSFSSFLPSELETASIYLLLTTQTRQSICSSPDLQRFNASIFRLLVHYPPYGPNRLTLLSDLAQLVGYHLYRLENGYVDIADDLCQEQEVDPEIGHALSVVRGWSCDGEWRKGEEWMGDALAAVVAGTGGYDWLPWTPC